MQIVVKLHSRCNLDCTYCYMYHKGDTSFLTKPKRLPAYAIEGLADAVLSYLSLSKSNFVYVSLHGGEPLLVGKPYFRNLMEYLSRRIPADRVHYTLQTNAVLIDDEWLAIFKEFNIVVSASIDGPPALNDRHRKYRNGAGSGQKAEEGIRKLAESEVDFAGVICVVDHESNGASVVDYFIDELRVGWFDLLLPDFTHDDIGSGWIKFQVGYLNFLISAFDRWFARLDSGVICRFFESILAKGLGEQSRVDTIGMDGVRAVVLETDGTLEPHDVARICQGFDRRTGIDIGPNAISDLLLTPAYTQLENRLGARSLVCSTCHQFDVCHGGQYFHRYSKSRGFENPSVHCYALRGFLDHVANEVSARARYLAD